MRHAVAQACGGLVMLVVFISGMGSQAAVAGGKMYWTDTGTDKIQRANLDGSGVEDLIMTYASGLAAGGGRRRGLALELER